MKKRTKAFVVVAILMAVLATLAFVTGIGPYDLPSQSRKLEAVMAESKRLGLPMTVAELVGDTPPPETNAAIGVMAALPDEFNKSQSDIYSLKISELISMSNEDRARVEAEIEPYVELLSIVASEVGGKSNWYVSRDYDLGPNLLFDEYAKLKYVCKLFALRSRLKALGGDSTGAIQDLKSGRKLASLISQEPILIGVLVAIALDAIALRAFEDLVVVFRDDHISLNDLEAALVDTQSRIDCRQALRGEFYHNLTVTRNLKHYGGLQALSNMTSTGEGIPQVDPSKLQREGLPKGLLARASMATYAECWNEVFRQLNKSDGPARGFGETIDIMSRQWSSEMRASRILPSIMMPVFSQVDQSLKRCDGNQECALIFVRAFAHRARTGAWPRDLKESGLDVEDPFSPDESVKFFFRDDDVRVWSIGPNGIDENGVWGKIGLDGTELPNRADDWGFLWPRPVTPTP